MPHGRWNGEHGCLVGYTRSKTSTSQLLTGEEEPVPIFYRNQIESSRQISLVHNDRSHTTICQPGHLNMTTHMIVLKALEHRATRYRVKGRLSEVKVRSHCWGLDDTGTINTTYLRRSREEIQQEEQIDILGLSDKVLQVHGVLLGRKEEGIT
jgi:hypothetical protein